MKAVFQVPLEAYSAFANAMFNVGDLHSMKGAYFTTGGIANPSLSDIRVLEGDIDDAARETPECFELFWNEMSHEAIHSTVPIPFIRSDVKLDVRRYNTLLVFSAERSSSPLWQHRGSLESDKFHSIKPYGNIRGVGVGILFEYNSLKNKKKNVSNKPSVWIHKKHYAVNNSRRIWAAIEADPLFLRETVRRGLWKGILPDDPDLSTDAIVQGIRTCVEGQEQLGFWDEGGFNATSFSIRWNDVRSNEGRPVAFEIVSLRHLDEPIMRAINGMLHYADELLQQCFAGRKV